MNRLHVATAGLFAAWLAHDLEELATLSANSRALVTRLPDWVPVPASVRQRGLTQRYLAAGVSAVGLVIAGASVRGYRRGAARPSIRTHSSASASTGSGTSASAFSHAATRVVSRPLPRSSSRSGCGQPRRYSKPALATDAAFRPRSHSSQDPSPAVI